MTIFVKPQDRNLKLLTLNEEPLIIMIVVRFNDHVSGLTKRTMIIWCLYLLGLHPFPYRTRRLSLLEPMILQGKPCGKVGRRQLLDL